MNSQTSISTAPSWKKTASKAFWLIIGLFVVYRLLMLAYMNVRDDDPLLSGWQDYNAAAFENLLADGKPVMVEVYAPWCPTCLAQHKAFEALESEGKRPNLATIRVDFDRDVDFRKTYNINYTGTILLFEGGKLTAVQGGLTSPEKLEGFLAGKGYMN